MSRLTGLDKGVPGHVKELSGADVAATGWNVLREALPLPVCVLHRDALERNAARLQRFADASGALLCPHGKTSMSHEIAEKLDERDLFDGEDVLLTAGGSAFLDLVTQGLSAVRLSRPARVVLRSGCYLTHDSGIYDRLVRDVGLRTGSTALAFAPALEIWAQGDAVALAAQLRSFDRLHIVGVQGYEGHLQHVFDHIQRRTACHRAMSRLERAVNACAPAATPPMSSPPVEPAQRRCAPNIRR